VARVEGSDETQGGAHIRRPSNLVQPYQVVRDPPDPWGQWGPGRDVFDVGPQGQGLWTGTKKMSPRGSETEVLVFHFSPPQTITEVRLYRNPQDECRERFPRGIVIRGGQPTRGPQLILPNC
jgi:hypothetical protein